MTKEIHLSNQIIRLTSEQREAVEALKHAKGRFYKSRLRQAWETGQYKWNDPRVCYLQQIRNMGGMRLL